MKKSTSNKRTKHVYTSVYDVVAVWSQNVRPSQWDYWTCTVWGRHNRVFAEHGRLYSYGSHWPIAQHVKSRRPFTVLNTAYYSRSTYEDVLTAKNCIRGSRVNAPSPRLLFCSRADLLANKRVAIEEWERYLQWYVNKTMRLSTCSPVKLRQLQRARDECAYYFMLYKVPIPSKLLNKVDERLQNAKFLEYCDKQTETERKLQKVGKELRHCRFMSKKQFESWENPPSRSEQIAFTLVKIGLLAEHRVRSIRQLPEEAIRELAYRTGLRNE